MEDELARARAEMVDHQLRERGITDLKVLEAMREVPRHRFVPDYLRSEAYTDQALPLGPEQTISQPYIVALMLEAARLRRQDRVLEIGTGSGYQTALLSRLVARVYSIELDPGRLREATRIMTGLGCANVETRCGDGGQGWPEAAPFDAIIVTAAPESVPRELVAELALGGRLIIPLGEEEQILVRFERTADGLVSEELGAVRFVPMRRGN